MANYSQLSANTFLIALMLFAATTPQAHGIGVSVTGRICCAPNLNCLDGNPVGLAGMLVSLNCTILGANIAVGQTKTDVNGTYNITNPAIQAGLVISNLILSIPCVVVARITPLDVCPAVAAAAAASGQTAVPSSSAAAGASTGSSSSSSSSAASTASTYAAYQSIYNAVGVYAAYSPIVFNVVNNLN